MQEITCVRNTIPIWMWQWKRLVILLLVFSATVVGASRAHAQTGQIVLTVRLLTVDRTAVPGVVVEVIDAATTHRLAQGTTDDRGEVRFSTMPPTEIRVRIMGMLPDGTTLRHTRQDQPGIWVNLPGRDWLMDLRADSDGLIFPDLGLGNAGAPDASAATAIADGTLPTVYPTAPVATIAPGIASPRMDVAEPRPAARVPTPVGVHLARSATVPSSNLGGIALLVLLMGMIGGVLWMSARNRL